MSSISVRAGLKNVSIEDLATRSGFASETIVLSSGLAEEPEPQERSTAVRLRLVLHNPLRGTRTELRIFKDNLMEVSEQSGKKPPVEHLIDLRFIDPSPRLSRYIAKKTQRVALSAFAVAGVGTLLAINSILPIVTLPLTLSALALATAMTIRYAKRTCESVDFLTKHGRAKALSLTANLGCRRTYRAAVPGLVDAIRYANGKISGDRRDWLRQEIREHYRLAKSGAIAKAECELATRSILAAIG